ARERARRLGRARHAAAVAGDHVAVVAGLARLDLAVAADVGGHARAGCRGAERVAHAARARSVVRRARAGGVARPPVFDQAARAAAVAGGGVAVVAALAGLEFAVAARVGRLADAGRGVARLVAHA